MAIEKYPPPLLKYSLQLASGRFRGGPRVHFGVQVFPKGEVGKEKGHGTPYRFLNPASGVSIARSSSGLGLGRKPESGDWDSLSPLVNIICAEIFRFFGRIPNPNSICKGFPIYESYGKISERADSGKLFAIQAYLLA